MHRVLIVDDVSWIVESLKASIYWKGRQCEVIGQVYNGEEAYEKILALKPDIVFTDIRMPGMSGLELIKKTKEIYPKIQFIIISGYAEFAYAQEALNYGAVGYCLKPFDETVIIGLLEKAKQVLKEHKKLKELILMDLLENDAAGNTKVIYEIFEQLGLVWEYGKSIFVLLALGNCELEFPTSIRYIKLKIGVNKNAYLFDYSWYFAIRDQLVSQCVGEKVSIGLGGEVKDVSGILAMIEAANIAAYQFFITEKNGVYEDTATNRDGMNDILSRIGEAIRNKDILSLEKLFVAAGDAFLHGLYNISHAFRFYNMVISFLYEFPDGSVYNYDQLVCTFKNVQNMVSYLKKLVSDQISVKPQHIADYAGNEAFKSILIYVNEHFYKELSIHSLSQKYFINPSYISHLFKKVTGETFTEYLSKLRISQACDMLKHSDLPVGEIGEKVGFNDYFYFTRIFKKVMGKTPTQHREEVK